jgi:hypothetical protein
MNRENIQLTARIIAKDTEALYEIARARGIQMPHPALGIFKSILCEIEKPNANGIRLGTKATDAAVSTLVGTQINRNHLRTDNVLGHTIDAVINKDKEIEITCIFFKDIYSEEWDSAQELFQDNKLTMSFELSADVESQDKLGDGTKRLNDFYFTGAGLLFGVKPACKKARVFEIATRKLSDKLTMERQSLIFANNQSSQKSIMEVLKLMADEVKKIEEVPVIEVVAEVPVVVPEEIKVEEAQKLCPECQGPMENDECSKCKKAVEEVKVAEVVVEAPVTETPIVVEPVVEAKVEEVVAQPVVEEAPKDVVVITETTQLVTDTMSQNSETIKVETKEVRTVNDQEQVRTVTVQETTYTYAQVEEIKAGYEKQVAELKEQIVAKDAEIVSVKATAEKLAAKEIVEAEEKPILSTGHKRVDASSEEQGSPIAKLLKKQKANRK